MLRIGIFVAFVVAYVLWAVACALIINRVQNDLLKGKSFWSGELLLLVTYLGFFGSIYLLSGFWSLKLVGLFFAASQVGILVAFLLNVALGAQSERSGMRGLWAGKEIDIKFPKLMKSGQVLAGLVFVSYPIVAGVLYFRYPRSSEVLKILIVKYSLLLQILGYLPVFTAILVSILVSENLDEDTRQRYMINQVGGMIPNALYIALAIWAFGIGGVAQRFDYTAVRQTLSMRTVLELLALFTAIFVVPFVLGSLRAGRRNLSVLEKKQEYASKLEEILVSPTQTQYVGKLTALKEEAAQAREKLTSGDEFLQLAELVEKNPQDVPQDAKLLVNALHLTRDLDPRFRLLDHLSLVQKEVEEITADLQTRADASVEEAAAKWSKKFAARKAEIAEEIKSAKTVKPLLVGLLGTAAGAIISPILAEVGKASWQIITHSGH